MQYTTSAAIARIGHYSKNDRDAKQFRTPGRET